MASEIGGAGSLRPSARARRDEELVEREQNDQGGDHVEPTREPATDGKPCNRKGSHLPQRASYVAMPSNRAPSVTIDARAPSPQRIARTEFSRRLTSCRSAHSSNSDDESDPRSLRNEMQQYRPGRFSWDARNHGSGRWTIRLERIDERADTATFLSHCPPFASARQATIGDLAAQATERSYRSGETIFDEGEMWPYLAFVRSGKVVYTLLSPDGKTHALGERLTHDSINESGTFDQGGATTRAEALTDCSLVLLPAEAILHAVRNDAELGLGFLAAASQARRRSIDTIADLAFAHVLQRVAKFLVSYAPATTGMAPGLPGVENLSQAQIAAAAGDGA